MKGKRHHATPGDTPATPARDSADARTEAMRLLSEGLSVTEVARRVGASRQTVSKWKNHTALPELAAAREVRAQTFEDAVTGARATIRDNTLKAAQVLVDQLADPDPAIRAAAARTLLDRGGLPRVEVVETGPTLPLDLSGLTDDELAVVERVLLRSKGGRS